MDYHKLIINYINDNITFVHRDYRLVVFFFLVIFSCTIARFLCKIAANFMVKHEDEVWKCDRPLDEKDDTSTKTDEAKVDNWLEDIKDYNNCLDLNNVYKNGLVGVLIKENIACLIEANCESSTTIKERYFLDLVKTAANACIQFADRLPKVLLKEFTKLSLDLEQLKGLKVENEKMLVEFIEEAEKKCEQKMYLKRATCYRVNADMKLSGYTLPADYKNDMLVGKFGCLVAYKATSDRSEGSNDDLPDVGKMLCQQIIAMDPKEVGNEFDAPKENINEEICLILQNYIFDPKLQVKDVLNKWNIEVINFKRYACGEIEDETAENI